MTLAEWIIVGVAVWLVGVTFAVVLVKVGADADDRIADALREERRSKGKGTHTRP